MTEGDIGLTPLPQADGRFKPRPAILLRRMPPFGDWLICGVKAASIIRPGLLTTMPAERLLGVIGSISYERHARLLDRLSSFLASERGA